MDQVVELLRTFVREYPLIVLGIMALGVLILFLDQEMTLICPIDKSAMQRVDGNSFQCNRCGFVKRV